MPHSFFAQSSVLFRPIRGLSTTARARGKAIDEKRDQRFGGVHVNPVSRSLDDVNVDTRLLRRDCFEPRAVFCGHDRRAFTEYEVE